MATDLENKDEQRLLFETRSEEVQEIMGRMPSWLIRYGMIFIGLVVCLVLLGIYFIKLPEKVYARIYLSSDAPPVQIIAERSGRVKKINVTQNDSVDKDSILIILDNSADYTEILALKQSLIDQLPKAPSSMAFPVNMNHLGELQNSFDMLLMSTDDVHSLLEHNNAHINKPKKRQSLLDANRKLILGIKQLLRQIEEWEKRYVIKSPVSGRVNLYSTWKEGQYIRSGQTIMVVVPDMKNIVAKGLIDINSSGKVKIGQPILIDLQSHPQNEYGYVEGMISYISSVPLDSTYSIDIKLTNGLLTTSNKRIPAQPQMYGTGEIVTDNKNEFSRLMETLKK